MSEESHRQRFSRRLASGEASARLYAILDREVCARRGLDLLSVAKSFREAGVWLLQYRDKISSDEEVLQNATAIAHLFADTGAILILNDRISLLRRSGFHGVHVGQDDLSVELAREMVGPDAVLGVSTHNPAQVAVADGLDVCYVAVGPVFTTGSKADADPVVGLEGVEQARSLTRRPLVAIGGITSQRVPEVLAAGADCIAAIGALVAEDPAGAAAGFLRSFARS